MTLALSDFDRAMVETLAEDSVRHPCVWCGARPTLAIAWAFRLEGAGSDEDQFDVAVFPICHPCNDRCHQDPEFTEAVKGKIVERIQGGLAERIGS